MSGTPLSDFLSAHPELVRALRLHDRTVDRAEAAETLQALQELASRPPTPPSARTAFDSMSPQPLVIGGRDGIHPSVLDMRVEGTIQPSTYPTACPPQLVVWIPVVLYPRIIKETRGSFPSYVAGSTRIRESYATGVFPLPQWATPPSDPSRPLHTGKFKAAERSLTAYAVVTLHHKHPHEVAEILDRRLEKEDLETVGWESDLDGEVDSPLTNLPVTDIASPPFQSTPSPSPTDRFSPSSPNSELRR
jgi:hypothetical protein